MYQNFEFVDTYDNTLGLKCSNITDFKLFDTFKK